MKLNKCYYTLTVTGLIYLFLFLKKYIFIPVNNVVLLFFILNIIFISYNFFIVLKPENFYY